MLPELKLNFWFGKNNTMANISFNNKIVFWTTAKKLNFSGNLKSSKYATIEIIRLIIKELKKNYWKKPVVVIFFGFSWGQKYIMRFLKRNRILVYNVVQGNYDAHNGCRLKKKKRKKKKLIFFFKLQSTNVDYIFDFFLKFKKNIFLKVSSLSFLPIKHKKITLLKSPFVNSKARITYVLRYTFCIFKINFKNICIFRFFVIEWLKINILKRLSVKLNILSFRSSYKF